MGIFRLLRPSNLDRQKLIGMIAFSYSLVSISVDKKSNIKNDRCCIRLRLDFISGGVNAFYYFTDTSSLGGTELFQEKVCIRRV